MQDKSFCNSYSDYIIMLFLQIDRKYKMFSIQSDTQISDVNIMICGSNYVDEYYRLLVNTLSLKISA